MVQWFGSYLDGRFIQTRVNGTLSNKVPITAVVPKGSVLGPLLFLLYIKVEVPFKSIFQTIEASQEPQVPS